MKKKKIKRGLMNSERVVSGCRGFTDWREEIGF